MRSASRVVVSGLLACMLVCGQSKHAAQVCNTFDNSDCYNIDTSVIGGLRYEDYRVTNPKAVQFDPAMRLKELAALGQSAAATLCQAPTPFTTPAPTITFNNVQAQIRWNPANNGFPDSQFLDVEFANFTASNGYTSPSFGFKMTRAVDADGTLQRQYLIAIVPGNPGLQNVVGLENSVAFTIDPATQIAFFSGVVPASVPLRQAVFGMFTHVQSILSAANFTVTNTAPPSRSLWTASDIMSLAGQAQPLIAATADAAVPVGPPFSCTVPNCPDQAQLDAFNRMVLTWGGEYLGLRTSQSFNYLVRNLLTWARANAPTLAPGVPSHSLWFSVTEIAKPILMLWPTLRDDPALAATDRLTIENWISNTLVPRAVEESQSTNDLGYFGYSDLMADAIRRSDHDAFARSIEKFYVALNQMRLDGSFPLEAQRSACSAVYTNVDILHLTSMAEMAATQGYDLYQLNVNGKTLETTIEFFLNARDNPALLSQYSKTGGGDCGYGKPGDPPEFSVVLNTKNVPSDLAWVESYLARFPFSTTAQRLRNIVGSNLTAAPFPMYYSYTGVNASCAFRKSYEFRPVNGTKVAIASGDGQTIIPNQSSPAPLSVRVTDNSGNALASALVSFAVVNGSANLVAPAQVLTDATGLASATVTVGPLNGVATVTATALGTAVRFSLVISGPAIRAGGILGIAASQPAVTTISPGAMFSIYGHDFAAAGANSGGNPVTTLAGVCVTVGGLSAPIHSLTPSQINAVAPAVTPGAIVDVTVTTGCGTPGAKQSAPQPVTVAIASPEFFYFAHNPNGQNPVAAIHAVRFGYIGPASIGPGFGPAHPGDLVAIFGSGFGPTDPPVIPGVAPNGGAPLTSPVTVTLGPMTLDASDILYVGAAPGSIISQLNIRIPSAMPAGNQLLQIRIGGIASPAGAFLPIAVP